MSTPRLGWLSGRRRRRIGAALALIAVIAVVVIVVLSAGSSSPSMRPPTPPRRPERPPSSGATWSRPTPSPGRSATPTRRRSTTASAARSPGCRAVRQVIQPGRTLFKVDGEPVVLMDGTTPAYRDSVRGRQRRSRHPAAQSQPRAPRLQPRRDRGRRHLAAGTTVGVELFPGFARRDRDRRADARSDRVPARAIS